MTEPARRTEEQRDEQDDSARSGKRRIAQPESGNDALPPTPEVLRKRERVTTGAYSIVQVDKDGRVAR